MLRIGNLLFHFRNYLFPVIILCLAVFSRPQLPFGSEDWDLYLDLLGVLVALTGQGLRLLTIGYDYIKRGGLDRNIYADRLVTRGVFGHCRNPLYVGNFLIFLGMTLMINSPLAYLAGIPICLFSYVAIILAEEDYLRRHFGAEYEDYCRRVNRLWPNWKNFSQSIEDMEFRWKRVITKEYNTTFAWLALALFLQMWESYRFHGEDSLPSIERMAYLLIPLAFSYALVRHIKKTGRSPSRSL
jgi:protein-S-isoprenylcysteine O-methyltransferase Ste14